MISRDQAVTAVLQISDLQRGLHGDHQHDVPGWLIIMHRQLRKVEAAWYRGDKSEALIRIAHVAACGVTALEQNAIITPEQGPTTA